LGDIPSFIDFARLFRLSQSFLRHFFVILVWSSTPACVHPRLHNLRKFVPRPRANLPCRIKSRQDDAMNPDIPSLPQDHPINDTTPTCVHAITTNMLELIRRICQLARHEARSTPSQTGFYPITLLADAKGNVLCDEAGVPVVVRAPLDILAINLSPGERAVVFEQPNKMVKRSEAVRISGTSTSALKRAEAKGELRAEKVGERDTSYLMADLNGWMWKRLLRRSLPKGTR
jgi:hypothetical protein